MEDNNEVHADKFLEAQKPLVGMKNQKIEEPWDEVFRGKPDLIASGRSDRASVLLKMSRGHANILGAYLNGRNDIAPLPPLVVEVLEALTMRLVQPPGSRWADLRRALQGQPVILPHQVDWKPLSERNPEHFPKARHRRPDVGDPSDLRADLRRPPINNANLPETEVLLGDADGTTMAEWPEEQR